MSCCVPTIYTFSNVTSSTIGYANTALSQAYGTHPRVQVMYYDPEAEEFYIAPWFTRVAYSGGQITVTHGGLATGIISIS